MKTVNELARNSVFIPVKWAVEEGNSGASQDVI